MGGLLDSVLHDVSPRDPVNFSIVPATLMLVGALACYRPARRAASIDPAASLRQE
jgi:ABC-type lipoprotein release transport system permease subunit